MKIVPAYGLNGSPAAVIMGECEKVYVDPLKWLSLSRSEREFILAHEQAHCVYGIEGEAEADSFALNAIQESGINPQAAFNAIQKTLDTGSNPNHWYRSESIQQQINAMAATPIDVGQMNIPQFDNGSYSPGEPNQQSSGFNWNEFANTALQVGGEVATGIFGQDPQTVTYNQPQPNTQSSFPWLYVAAAAALVAVGWFLLKK